MAHPSSSHRDRDRDDDRATTRERAHRSSSSHHHRTISSTTLLLVLSLILAVLAVMLSLPSRSGGGVLTSAPRSTGVTGTTETPAEGDGASHSFWGYLTPKRSHALVSRESAVAFREAEVARREAELLAGLPGGLPYACPVCGESVVEEIRDISPSIALVNRPSVPAPPSPTVTVIKEIEITKEVEPSTPNWLQSRIEAIVDREKKISDREKEVGSREEAIGRREADTTKREGWIIEQLQHLSADVVEEQLAFDHDHPRHFYGEARRAGSKVGNPPPPRQH